MEETSRKINDAHALDKYLEDLENCVGEALDDLEDHIVDLEVKAKNVVEIHKEVLEVRGQLDELEKSIGKRLVIIENLPARCLGEDHNGHQGHGPNWSCHGYCKSEAKTETNENEVEAKTETNENEVEGDEAENRVSRKMDKLKISLLERRNKELEELMNDLQQVRAVWEAEQKENKESKDFETIEDAIDSGERSIKAMTDKQRYEKRQERQRQKAEKEAWEEAKKEAKKGRGWAV